MPETASAADLRLAVTTFDSLTNTARWTVEEVDWATWAGGLEHREYLAKESAPLVGLYRLRPGSRRSADAVIEYTGLCLDFDDVGFESVAETAEALAEAGVSYLWHTTWSHLAPGKGERRRLLVPLAEPLPPGDYHAAMAWVRENYAPDLDVNATQTSQAFFVPCYRPGEAEAAELHFQPGGGLRLQLTARPKALPAKPTVPVRRELWEKLAKQWARRTWGRWQETSTSLQAVCDGVRYAERGERDGTTYRLIHGMLTACPDASTESIVDLFKMSLHRMALDDGADAITDAVIREKTDRIRSGLGKGGDLPDNTDRQEAIGQLYGTERKSLYSDVELEVMADRLGCTVDELQRRWILHHERQYYLVGPEAEIYSCQKEGFDNLARVVLSPAPIDLQKFSDKGRVQVSRQELLEKHSTPLTKVKYSLVASQPRLNGLELTLPTCPLRSIQAACNPEIAEWLRLLAGPRHDELLRWLTLVPDLSRPLAALVLTGPPSSGKSMLAQGLARLWSTGGPSSLDQALSRFPTALMACPYVTADEGQVPRDSRGYERTEDLRSFIQSTSRQINQKHRDEVDLEGAVRLQVSANNDNVLTLASGLSGDDVDAIAARFLHVPASGQAAQYLAELGGRGYTEPWVAEDGIAAHVLWLRETIGVEWVGRFGVAQRAQDQLVNRMLVRSGVRSQVCELLTRAIRDEQPLADGAAVIDGRLMIQLDWVIDSWQTYLRRVAVPDTTRVIQALDGLAERLELAGEGWFRVKTTGLEAWAVESGSGSPDRVRGWLARHERMQNG